MVNLPAIIFLKLENTTKLNMVNAMIKEYINLFLLAETTYIALGINTNEKPINAPASLDENTGLFLNMK